MLLPSRDLEMSTNHSSSMLPNSRLVPIFAEMVVVSSTVFVMVFFNLSWVVSLTSNIPLVYFAMNVLGLVTIFLIPHAMHHDGAIDLAQMSKLFLVLTGGLGSSIILVLGLASWSRLILDPSYSSRLLVTFSAAVLIAGYSMIFWGLSRQVIEKRTLGHTVSSFDATSPKNFLKLALLPNIFVASGLVALLFASDYALASGLVVFQISILLLVTRLRGWLALGM